ncbi:cytochrome c oxidase subunit 3 [Halogranum rubrum]|uniref:Cytochrome c oxidase subunit 3 n=1 Tax=Halogranum rubrum TaxID=553466 RepID=A0A1I4EY48_9EURY|nr:cytochrome c oxidase subunit 3 [Halogranum rubrum]SFL10648.1 cytochrome c oxidase subunit 3 [Halogranum rubrum]
MSTEDSHDDHGHHLPAVEDWPRGFGEASWWPFVTAIGGAGIYVAAALYIIGSGEDPLVSPIIGQAVGIGSIGVLLIGIYGWLYHAFIVKFWERGESDDHGSGLRWGMIAFLGSELGTFGALFGYYFYIRAGATWPPAGMPEGLAGSLVLANTALLVASSFTLHWAEVSLRNENRRSFILGLLTTLILGTVFIGGQIVEYYEFIVHEGFTFTEGIYASAFFGLTGLHGLHVTLGAVLIGIVFVRALRGQYSARRHVSVTTASMYWHFVDVVWIFLVVVLYFGAEIGGAIQ